MKQGHLGMLFLILYLSCFLFLLVEQKRYDEINEEKQKIERALVRAIENTSMEFSSVVYASKDKKRQLIENVFWESLYTYMGISEDEDILKFCLPVFVLAEEDGVSFFHMKEISVNGITQVVHTWTECIPYEFPEECSEDKKKTIIVQMLEEKISEIISEHNYIATQYGISYRFSAPMFLQTNSEKICFPLMIAVFQGWPLLASEDIFYENCVDANVYLQEKKQYILEFPKDLEHTCFIYHSETCEGVIAGTGNYVEEYVTKQEAVQTYGAYPCGMCIP